jgi:Cu+-exporting ATPase
MLTGDNEQTAKVIADKVGIKNIIANVLPSEKNDKIKELQKDNKIVMMVGDGINDAPSLATANIGVSLSTGTDIANNSSDVIILNDDLSKIIDLINISEKTIKNIKQNLFWAFFYNSLMLPIALGLLNKWHIHITPMVAAFAMTISSLTVIFNALRLRIPLKERDEYHVWKKRKEES